jgi:hypothetical protein
VHHHLDFLNMAPTMADQWCNNKQAVKDTTRPIKDPSGMLKAKADIILDIHHLKNWLPFHSRIHHVYGHQDAKKIAHNGEQPQEQTYPAQVLINIAGNAIALTTSQYGLYNKGVHPPLPPILTPPYKGSQAMLHINNKWITSHYKEELYTARRTKPMEEYLKVKYNWNEQRLKYIHWPSIKTVRQQLSHTKRMQMCKIMHGWLPVAHMHHHITGTNQCQGCKCNNKTINHFLQCPHPSITEKRTNILKQMRAKGKKLKIPKDVLHAITQTLTAYTGSTQSINHNYNTAIKTRIKYQQKNGIDMMARGFLSKQWLHTIHPSRNPTQTMNKLQ